MLRTRRADHTETPVDFRESLRSRDSRVGFIPRGAYVDILSLILLLVRRGRAAAAGMETRKKKIKKIPAPYLRIRRPSSGRATCSPHRCAARRVITFAAHAPQSVRGHRGANIIWRRVRSGDQRPASVSRRPRNRPSSARETEDDGDLIFFFPRRERYL